MITWIWPGDQWKFAIRPVEFPGIDYEPAQRCAVPADKFRCRIDDDIYAVIEWPQDIRRDRIVQNERYAALVRDLRYSFQVSDVVLRVADRFGIYGLRL